MVNEAVTDRGRHEVLDRIASVRDRPVVGNRSALRALAYQRDAVVRERRPCEGIDNRAIGRREVASQHLPSRYRSRARGSILNARPFGTGEQKRPLSERSAQCRAELITAVGRCAAASGIEVVAGVECVVAEVVIRGAVKVASSRATDHIHLRPCAAPVFRLVARGVQPELAHRVQRRTHHDAVDVEIVVVDSVQQEVVGDLAASSDMEPAVVLR